LKEVNKKKVSKTLAHSRKESTLEAFSGTSLKSSSQGRISQNTLISTQIEDQSILKYIHPKEAIKELLASSINQDLPLFKTIIII